MDILSPLMEIQLNRFLEFGILFGAFLFGIYMTWKRFTKKSSLLKKTRKEEKSFMDVDKRNMKIYEKLMYLRIKSDASRVRICLFHNGGNFLCGDPIKKFTCTHEMTSSSVSNESQRFQNAIASVFIEKINIVKENSPKIRSLNELTLDESKTKYLYKATHVRRFSILPLKQNDLVIGFIEIEWNQEEPKMILEGTFESFFTMVKSQIELEMMKRRR
jgi:hypothetical protein